MGSNPLFTFKHNLETSSSEALAKDLENKLGLRVVLCGNSDLAEELNLNLDANKCDYKIENDKESIIYLEDMFLIYRLLETTYGDDARKILARIEDGDYYLIDYEEMKRGKVHYNVYIKNATINKSIVDSNLEIGADTLSGYSMYFPEWFLFKSIYDEKEPYRDSNIKELMIHRRLFYNFFRPIINDLPVYLYSDQTLEDFEKMTQIKEMISVQDLSVFNISDYFLNQKSQICSNMWKTVFIDDYQDLFNEKNNI